MRRPLTGVAVAADSTALMAIRMKRLPRRHRIAHLRALIRLQSLRSVRHARLVTLLREQLALQAECGKCRQ